MKSSLYTNTIVGAGRIGTLEAPGEQRPAVYVSFENRENPKVRFIMVVTSAMPCGERRDGERDRGLLMVG